VTNAHDAQVPAGVIPPTATGGRSGFLSDVIVELGFAGRDTVERAVRAARSPGTTVARVLVETGAITEEQLAQASAETHGIHYIDLDEFEIDPAAANLISPPLARRYQAVPVAFLDGGLLVAMADPADALGVDDIAVMTKLDVRQAVAPRPVLEALLDALPLDEPEGFHAEPAVQPAPEEAPTEPPAVSWTDSEALPPAPPSPAPAGDASRLRAELDALKAQLAGAEARLASHGMAPEEISVEELRSRLAEAEGELEESRIRVREAKEVGAELETLRDSLAAAEARLDQASSNAREEAQSAEVDDLRAQLAAVTRERDSARARAHEASAELRRALEAAEAQAPVPERRGLAELEGRLAELERSSAAAERAFEELRRAQGRVRDAVGGLGHD
jgi:hypothetical protein